MLESEEAVVMVKAGVKWIFVSAAFEDRLEEVMLDVPETLDEVMDYLEESDIPYICITSSERDIKIHRRYPE